MATFSTAIAASTDDAVQRTGTVTVGFVTNTIEATDHYLGLRFNNVTIAQGSTINTATLDLDLPSTLYDDPDATIYCQAADDAATFSTATNDISTRTPTTATAAWSGSSLGVGVETTSDFAAAVQEVIGRAGWASGNDLVVILQGASSSCNLRVRAYDGGTGTYPTINIDYTAPAGGSVTKIVHHYRMQRGGL